MLFVIHADTQGEQWSKHLLSWIYERYAHFDVEQVGECVHVVDAIRILIPQLVEQSQSLVYI